MDALSPPSSGRQRIHTAATGQTLTFSLCRPTLIPGLSLRPRGRAGLRTAAALQPSRTGRNHLLWLARSPDVPQDVPQGMPWPRPRYTQGGI
jgi:hypothetical protein